MRKKDRIHKKAMKRIMKRLDRSFRKPGAARAMKDVSIDVSSYIQQQLQRPSFIHSVFQVSLLAVDPPYRMWAGEDNVVHWTGIDVRDKWDPQGPYQDRRIVRFCDFQEVDEGRMVDESEAVTCLMCHANQKDRTKTRSAA